MFTAESVKRALDDLVTARNAGLETPALLLNLGAMKFHESLRSGRTDLMADSVQDSRRALDLLGAEGGTGRSNINAATAQANLGVALLGGGGHESDAQEAYAQASDSIARLPSGQSALVGGALTPLDQLAAARPALAPAVRRAKEIVIGKVYGVSASPSQTQVVSLRISVQPARLQWFADLPGLGSQDKVVMQWYRTSAPSGDSWYPLPAASGPLQLGGSAAGGWFIPNPPTRDAYFGDNDVFLRNFVPTCLSDGQYRLELYVNGHLAGEARGRPESAGTPYLMRDVGVALCRPNEWTLAGRIPGIAAGFRSPDGTKGIAVFRVHQPRNASDRESLIAAVRRIVQDGRLLPPGLGAGVARDPATQPFVFSQPAESWEAHAYQGGTAKLVAPFSFGTGSPVVVVCVYGPNDWVDSPESWRLVLSMVPL